jgi:hypothetical protein
MKPLAKGDFTGLKQSKVMSLQSLSKRRLGAFPAGRSACSLP